MVNFKVFLGVLMLLTAIWFLYFLKIFDDFGNFEIAEVIVISSTDSQKIIEIQNYLSNKWGLIAIVDSDGDGLMDADDPEPTIPIVAWYEFNDSSDLGKDSSGFGNNLSIYNNEIVNYSTNASEDASFLNDTAPTSTVFTLGNADDAWNANSAKFIAYCWHEVSGYSKFGTYTGNGSSDGMYIHLGFRPAFILLKSSDATRNWVLIDNKRSAVSGANQNDYTLEANNGNNEYTNGAVASTDMISKGFKFRGSAADSNNSGTTYIYMAFAEQPGVTPFDTFPNAR